MITTAEKKTKENTIDRQIDTKQINTIQGRFLVCRIKMGQNCHITLFYIAFSDFLTDTNSPLLIKENIVAVVSILVSDFAAAI